jgi:hypothetical protein
MCSPSLQFGTTDAHDRFESLVARFVGKEAAMVFGMGFATNSLGLPALAGPGTLISACRHVGRQMICLKGTVDCLLLLLLLMLLLLLLLLLMLFFVFLASGGAFFFSDAHG